MELPLFGDDDGGARAQQLVLQIGAWSVLWVVILQVVPAGASGRNHIVSLNAAHGAVCTLASVLTLALGLPSTTSVAVSLSYFLVDFVAMVNADALWRLPPLHRSRQMDYMHHVLGLVWGYVFFAQEASVCDADTGNPYVWIQTNEVSTPFYNWFRLTDNKLAGALFALSFFASRVVFNTVVLVPKFATRCDVRYLFGTAPFFLMQYVWFAMIVNKLHRALAGGGKRAKSDGERAPGKSVGGGKAQEPEPLPAEGGAGEDALAAKKDQ